MREKLLVILGRAARRVLIRRLLESAAVLAAAGGLAAAGVEFGWWLASASRPAGAVPCVVLVVLGVWLWTRPAVRDAMRLDLAHGSLAGVLCVVGGAVGALGALLGWADVTPRWAVGVVLLGAGAAVGAALAVARGVSALQAAVFLDIHGELDERLATAVEAAGGRDDGPLAEQLYSQAVAALEATPPRSVPAWRRTRATLGALGLAVLLCLAMWALPSMGARGAAPLTDLAELPDALGEMSPRTVQLIVATMQIRAGQNGVSDAAAEALRRSARAVQSKDAERVRKALADLVKALETADEATRRRIESAILAAAGGGAGGRAPVAGGTPNGNGGTDPQLTSVARSGGKPVRVYHPEYADALRRMRRDGAAAPAGGGGGRHVAMGLVWRRARDDAAAALAAGHVPIDYRPIIRAFFDTEQSR